MIICNKEFSSQVIEKIKATITKEPELSRRALSHRVCEWLDWRSPTGSIKAVSCRVALLKLHRAGMIRLPDPKASNVTVRVHKTSYAQVDVVDRLRCNLDNLGKIALIKVTSRYSQTSAIWNSLMQQHHYLGAGPLCGAQIRYLIQSEVYGWLGGLSFSAAAWRVDARDAWIGWNDAARKHNLHRVVANSRFLILSQVKVPHLASHVLSRCMKRLGQDWFTAYGVTPVLVETFVAHERFKGTSYRAANFTHIGTTRGRGRQDRRCTSSVPIKDIFVYPLRGDAAAVLCECSGGADTHGGAPDSVSSQRGAAGDWVAEELRRTDFGDRRLHNRLLSVTRDFYARPQASVPQACETRAKTKAAYRFFEHKETTMDTILTAHYESTARRIGQQKVVLAVQDTTSLNYSAHPATEGLGTIGSYRTHGPLGLLVHDTMAFTVDGTPLGLVDMQCWARDSHAFGKAKKRHHVPIEHKESYKWLQSFQKVAAVKKVCPSTQLVSVGDREADIYELFAMAKQEHTSTHVLVRAKENRILVGEQRRLWEKVSQESVSGIQEISVPRKGNHPRRTARLEVRFAQVTLMPPHRKQQLGALTIWALLAHEVDAPAGVTPLEWLLLTTIDISSFTQACELLRWYTLRWGIEVYHRTLKSGCKIEERRLGTADRIEACLAIDMIVAWRIYHLTKLGRETPTVPCTVFFEDEEWKALVSFKTQNPVPPDKPPLLREALHMVASLGGFLGRKCDGEPGPKSLWLGLQRLDDIAATWKYLTQIYAPHLLKPPVSSNPGYG
jgi:hypothetical protein